LHTSYLTNAVLTRDGAQALLDLTYEVLAASDLAELDVGHVLRVGRHLAQFVEQDVSSDGNGNDLDVEVLHDVGLDDGLRQVVRSTVDE